MTATTGAAAYPYPLLIKQLWHTPLAHAPDQEIVYRDSKRLTYRTLRERVGRAVVVDHSVQVPLASLSFVVARHFQRMDRESHGRYTFDGQVPVLGDARQVYHQYRR